MELFELKNKIYESFTGDKDDLQEALNAIKEDQAVFPFNEYEFLMVKLLETGGLTYQQYVEMRTEYLAKNPNLKLFEISAPRSFGEKWAQEYLDSLCFDLKKPSKKLDSSYEGQYDRWFDGIKIEVKASRAVDSKSKEPLYMKALSRDTHKPFNMNFQQLKPQCCDVFSWVAVFRDQIVIWVMSSNEVKNNDLYYEGQHRGNAGNEGQLHVNQDNIHLFNDFELGNLDLGQLIKDAAMRQQQDKSEI